MFGIGAEELLLILLILLLLFGGKKLPELSRSLGEAIRELRNGIAGEPSNDREKPEKPEKPSR